MTIDVEERTRADLAAAVENVRIAVDPDAILASGRRRLWGRRLGAGAVVAAVALAAGLLWQTMPGPTQVASPAATTGATIAPVRIDTSDWGGKQRRADEPAAVEVAFDPAFPTKAQVVAIAPDGSRGAPVPVDLSFSDPVRSSDRVAAGYDVLFIPGAVLWHEEEMTDGLTPGPDGVVAFRSDDAVLLDDGIAVVVTRTLPNRAASSFGTITWATLDGRVHSTAGTPRQAHLTVGGDPIWVYERPVADGVALTARCYGSGGDGALPGSPYVAAGAHVSPPGSKRYPWQLCAGIVLPPDAQDVTFTFNEQATLTSAQRAPFGQDVLHLATGQVIAGQDGAPLVTKVTWTRNGTRHTYTPTHP